MTDTQYDRTRTGTPLPYKSVEGLSEAFQPFVVSQVEDTPAEEIGPRSLTFTTGRAYSVDADG